MSIRSKAISATLWSGADVFLRQGLQFFVAIILARILSPEEFGTIALLYLFVGIAGVFVDSGFSTALIQSQDVTHTDESTVFWFNLSMGLLVAFSLWMSAPFISGFFSQPILIPLTALLALNVFISALGSIHGTLLTKRLDFRTQMKIGVFSSLVSGVVAVGMAWHGFGVWALVAQTLVATCITTVLLWVMNRWRPKFVFSFVSVRKLFAFGGYMLASGLLDVVYERGYTMLIGKFYGVRDLGFYSRADSTKQMPVAVLSGIFSRVAFPIFSAVAHDKVQLRRGVQFAVRGVMLLNVPMMLGLASVAEPLVLTLFGEQWLPAVPIMQVLCIGAIFWPLHVINLNVLMAQGYSHLFFRLEVVKKLLGVALLVMGTFYGLMGIAWSQVIFGVLAFFINAHYTKRHLGYSAVDQVRDFFPILAISISMFVSLSWLGTYYLYYSPVIELIILMILGSVIIFSLSRVFRLNALQDAIALFQSRKPFLPNNE